MGASNARRSKYQRTEIRVTDEWFRSFCAPRLTERDRQIFRFLSLARITTSEQVARLFWDGSKKAQGLCNRRLRQLYDLQCIDRFFPVVETGSSLQHIVLDRAGAKALGLSHFRRITTLPVSYRHTVYVSSFLASAYSNGWGWGKTEYRLGRLIADIYYPALKVAVEIDTGTQSRQVLLDKARKYNQTPDLSVIVFVSAVKERAGWFLGNLSLHTNNVGATFENFEKVFPVVRRMLKIA